MLKLIEVWQTISAHYPGYAWKEKVFVAGSEIEDAVKALERSKRITPKEREEIWDLIESADTYITGMGRITFLRFFLMAEDQFLNYWEEVYTKHQPDGIVPLATVKNLCFGFYFRGRVDERDSKGKERSDDF